MEPTPIGDSVPAAPDYVLPDASDTLATDAPNVAAPSAVAPVDVEDPSDTELEPGDYAPELGDTVITRIDGVNVPAIVTHVGPDGHVNIRDLATLSAEVNLTVYNSEDDALAAEGKTDPETGKSIWAPPSVWKK